MTGVLYTTSGHDRCFALARMTGGAGLEASWARRLGASFPPKYGAAVVLRRGVTPRRGQAASTAALRGLRNDAGGRMVLGSQVA